MKHLLLATSALVAFAGAAAAEVTVTGDGRIGLRYDSDVDALCETDVDGVLEDCEDSAWNVVSRARAIFTMTGETDSGLSFGATFRADTAGGATGLSGLGRQGNIWISGAYGKLSAGDVDSALENAVGDLPEVGLTGLDYYNEISYNSSDIDEDVPVDIDGDGDVDYVGNYQDDATLLYEYKLGDATLYASFADQYFDDTGYNKGSSWSLGAGYTLGNYSFGIGYEKSEFYLSPFGDIYFADASTWGISGGTSISGITFKAIYLSTDVENDDLDTDADVKQLGLGAEYTMANGVGLAGFWRKVEADGTFGGVDDEADATVYGLGASYDLGGGATLKGGIVKVDGDDDGDDDNDETLADFGISMKF